MEVHEWKLIHHRNPTPQLPAYAVDAFDNVAPFTTGIGHCLFYALFLLPCL